MMIATIRVITGRMQGFLVFLLGAEGGPGFSLTPSVRDEVEMLMIMAGHGAPCCLAPCTPSVRER